jgi:hypothetical protein
MSIGISRDIMNAYFETQRYKRTANREYRYDAPSREAVSDQIVATYQLNLEKGFEDLSADLWVYKMVNEVPVEPGEERQRCDMEIAIVFDAMVKIRNQLAEQPGHPRAAQKKMDKVVLENDRFSAYVGCDPSNARAWTVFSRAHRLVDPAAVPVPQVPQNCIIA